MSCEMEIDEEGYVVNYEIFESIIKIIECMMYMDVNDILVEKDEVLWEKYVLIVLMFEKM